MENKQVLAKLIEQTKNGEIEWEPGEGARDMPLASGVYFTAVKEAIDELDPEGLLEAGCPDDEYVAETEIFIDLMSQGERVTPALVERVWVEQFYPDCGLIKHELAQRLAQKLNSLQAE